MTADIDQRRGGVEVVDQIVLALDDVAGWLERWNADYRPGAVRRGLRHVATSRRFAGPDRVAVQITWHLDEPYAFYGMRGMAAADPAVAQFWAETDRLAISRDRTVSAVVAAEAVPA